MKLTYGLFRIRLVFKHENGWSAGIYNSDFEKGEVPESEFEGVMTFFYMIPGLKNRPGIFSRIGYVIISGGIFPLFHANW